jgi:hypothetical protein
MQFDIILEDWVVLGLLNIHMMHKILEPFHAILNMLDHDGGEVGAIIYVNLHNDSRGGIY